MTRAKPRCWPGTSIPKSTGNAFDLTKPRIIDWSPFYKRAVQSGKSSQGASAALADKPPNQHITISKRGQAPRRAGAKT